MIRPEVGLAMQPMRLRSVVFPEPLGPFNYYASGIRYIDADFDDRCRNQDIDLMIFELLHDVFFLLLGHLAVHDADAIFREDVFCQTLGLNKD